MYVFLRGGPDLVDAGAHRGQARSDLLGTRVTDGC